MCLAKLPLEESIELRHAPADFGLEYQISELRKKRTPTIPGLPNVFNGQQGGNTGGFLGGLFGQNGGQQGGHQGGYQNGQFGQNYDRNPGQSGYQNGQFGQNYDRYPGQNEYRPI